MDGSRSNLGIDKKSRRQLFLENLAVLGYVFIFLILGPLGVLILLYWSSVSYTGLACTLLYCTYIYLDRHTCETGGRRADWFLGLACWRYFRSYFPVELHKTTDLPPDRNYLLAAIPHGIIPIGVTSVFSSKAHNFQEMYPGITPYLCTFKALFVLPFIREIMRVSAIVASSEKSINWVLGHGQGRACALVVGGSAETLCNQPGAYRTIVKQRKGFCRMALKNGAPLVPVLSFGEVDLYKTRNNEKPLSCLQKWARRKIGFIPIRIKGEGFLGLIPKRVPIHVVVGAPIDVKKNINPTEEEVNLLHETFISNLIQLFEAEKHKYLSDPNAQLEFVKC